MKQASKLTGCLIYGGLALVAAGGVAMFAIIMAAAIGGAAIGVAPEWSFGLVKPVICPGESRLHYYSIERSYHEPGESEPHLECISDDGQNQDVLLAGIAAVVVGTFLLFFGLSFIAIYLPLAVLAFYLMRKFNQNRST